MINAGVPGWNLENALAYLQTEGLKFDPDLILLDLTLVNDIKGKSALLSLEQPATIEWLRANTYFWPFLTVQLRWMQARAEGNNRIDVINPPSNPEKYFPTDPASEQWTKFWDQVIAINQVARTNNIPLVLLIIPLEYQVLDENYPTVAQELLLAKATEAGIPAIDILPTFRNACQEKPGGKCYREDRYLFADVWMHPSAFGHKLAATEIEEALSGMLP